MKVIMNINEEEILHLQTINSLTKKAGPSWFLLFYTNDIPNGMDRVKDCIYIDDSILLSLQTTGKAIVHTENYEVELIKENYIHIVDLETAKV
jgi:hypothetical protein